jgi:hypothetical protein
MEVASTVRMVQGDCGCSMEMEPAGKTKQEAATQISGQVDKIAGKCHALQLCGDRWKVNKPGFRRLFFSGK